MTAIKVYGPANFSCVARVLVTLYEKNVENFELVPVNTFKSEHKTPEFLKLQPFGLVPVLQYGDLSLFESRAIARSVARKFEGQGTALFGATPKDDALVDQWMEVESQNFNAPCREIVNNVVTADGKGVREIPLIDEATLSSLLAKVEAVFDVYEKQLSSSKYLAGEFFSLADLIHLPNLQYLFKVANKEEVLDSRPAVKAWWEEISSRPSWKKTLQLADKPTDS